MANHHQEPSTASRDGSTEQLARNLADNVRQLNHATTGPPDLTQPSTVYTVPGNLTNAAHGLDQTLDQLQAFLSQEERAGGLAHDGQPVASPLADCGQELNSARTHTRRLGHALGQAQAAINTIHSTANPAVGHEQHPARLAAADTPYSIEEVLARQAAARRNSTPSNVADQSHRKEL